MKKSALQKLVFSAVCAALICTATMVVAIPTPLGYIHPGDGLVLLAGWLLGPFYGFAAAGLGSALADLLLGYYIYAPATLLIKGGTALLAAVLLQVLWKWKYSAVPASAAAETAMAAGYFLYESVFLGYGLGAAAAVPLNILQGVVGVVFFLLLLPLLRRLHLYEKLHPNK